MAWPKKLFPDQDKKEDQVPDPEKKVDEKAKEPEKSPAELIAESLKPLTDAFNAMKAEVDELKVKTTPKDKKEITSVMDDEDQAFNDRLTPIMKKTMELEAEQNLGKVEREYQKQGFGDLWEENRKEIETEIAGSELVTFVKGEVVPLRGNPVYIRNIADMVIGRALKKSGVRFDGKDKKFFLEDATGEETVITKREKVNEGVTKSQIQAANRFGIPIAQYRAAMAKLKFVDKGERA